MAALTLLQGDAQAEYVEHPIEVARRALIAAAEIETDHLATSLRKVAAALPPRAPLTGA